MFGKQNVQIDKTNLPGVALTRAQLQKLTDAAFVQRQIQRQKAAGGSAPLLSAEAIAEKARFITTATDKQGRSLFELVDKQTGKGIDKAVRVGHLEVREAVGLFNTEIAQQRVHVPAIMTGRIDGKVRTFAARDSWEFGASRRFEFNSKAQYDTLLSKLSQALVPLFSSPEFAKVVGKLVGARAVKPEVGGVDLRWTELFALREVANVEAAIRETGASPIAGVTDPAEAARRIVASVSYIADSRLSGDDLLFSALASMDGGATLSTRDLKRLLKNTELATASLPQ